MRVQDIDTGLQDLERDLFGAMMEPDPARADWLERRSGIDATRDKALALFAALEAALGVLGRSEREAWPRRAGQLGNQLVALLHASNDGPGKAASLKAALRVSPVGPLQDELEAARRAPDLHLALAHGRWLHQRERHADARVHFDKVLAGDEPLLRDAAELTEAVEPPNLKTWNGFGTVLSGRDNNPDNSYLTTYCLQAFWIPFWPIARYRVRHTREGLFFMAKKGLTAKARWMRRLLVTGVVALAGAAALLIWLNRPAHRFQQSMAAARAIERKGPPEAAEQRYLEIAKRFRGKVKLAPVASALVRIFIARGGDPQSPAALAALDLLASRLAELGDPAWKGGAGAALARHLEPIAANLETQGEAGLDGALLLLAHAARFAPHRDSDRLREMHDRLLRHRAEALANDWPLMAIEQLGQLGTEGRARQGELLVLVADTPGLIAEVEPQARDFVRWASGRSEVVTQLRKVEAALEAAGALAMDADRNRAVESGEPDALAAALRAHPTDQAVLAGLALVQASTDREAALAKLQALGQPGWLVSEARLVLIAVLGTGANLPHRRDFLAHEVSFRLPRYRALISDYEAAYRALMERLSQLDASALPAEMIAKLQSQPEKAQQEIIMAWAAQSAEDDPTLTQIRERARGQGIVIDLALQLAGLELERASSVPAAERPAVLAAAERAYLAVAGDASDRPDYHLGLGQAYHRLGRFDEARRELDGLLASDDWLQELQVSNAYRALGLTKRALEIAEKTQQRPEPAHTAAVLILAAMADTVEDRARWLGRGDPKHPEVVDALRTIEARRALLRGQLVQADALLAAELEFLGKRPLTPNRLNDESLAVLERFAATGRLEFLDQAVATLERAHQMAPENSILLFNLISTLKLRAGVGVLASHVALPRVHLDSSSADTVLDALLAGPQGDAIRAALRKQPSQHRAQALLRRLQTLAPSGGESYGPELELAIQLRDEAALTALAERLRGQAIDSESADRRREAWRKGERDRSTLEQVHGVLLVQAPVRDNRDPANAATAHLVTASQLFRLAKLEMAEARAGEAVVELRAAIAGWSALGVERHLANALLLKAALALASKDPALDAMLRRDWREFAVSQLVDHMPEAARQTLSQSVEGREALVLLRAVAARDPDSDDVVVGRALGDPELVRLGTPALSNPLKRLENEIALLIDPHSLAAKERAELKP